MSDVRIYVDEDAEEYVVVAGLRNRGIDVLTSTDAGQGGTSDAAQLTYAAGQRRAIYSLNVGDFARLHRDYLAQAIEHYGVIVIPEQRYSIGEKIRRIAALVAATTAEEMMSRMEFL
jgi:hypothetical protein